MRRTRIFAVAFALLAISGLAYAGGCLQGTWHYYNASGQLVGEETFGCGDMDGAWGSVTANKSFTPGCASAM